MNNRERFLAFMDYKPVDHAPFWAWGGWPETYERWKSEGYRPEVFNPKSIGGDWQWIWTWFNPCPPFKRQVIAETESHIDYINKDGVLMRELRDNPYSSMPQFLRFPVKNRKDFRKFWRERMDPDMGLKIGQDWRRELHRLRAKPGPMVICPNQWGGFFGPLRSLVGVENLCMLFFDDIALVEEMMDAFADRIIAIFEQVLSEIEIDAFMFWEDMAYKTGPLLSPDMARKYMLPRYQRVVEFLLVKGVRHIGLDSDGDIHSLIPVWLDAGINFLFPFEVQAGMDVVKIRKDYGRNLRLWGGIDKRQIAKGPEAIDRELERIRPLIEDGGYLAHPDHAYPPDTSYSNYCYFMDKLAEVCGKR